MGSKISDFGYKMMVKIGMPIRNIFMPPDKMLAEAKIKTGENVLDFGCGPGTFSKLIADQIGGSGMVYALDIHPLAIKMTEQKAREEGLSNIKTIQSNCDTSLPDCSIDRVVFFDVFHELENQQEVLVELHRVLKPNAVMCFSDHHMKAHKIVSKLTETGLFNLQDKGRRTFNFYKA